MTKRFKGELLKIWNVENGKVAQADIETGYTFIFGWIWRRGKIIDVIDGGIF